ncbi:MAG: MFS transporter [Dehalococcoidia bacterium]
MTDPSHPEADAPKGRRPIFYGWYIVAASIATNAIFSAAYFQGFNVLIIPIERTFGWDRWVISAAMSLRQMESGIASPLIGFLLDRFSPRRMIFWSAVIAAIGLVGLGLMNGIVMFFIFFFIVSLGASGLSHAVTWPVVIARWFRRNRGKAMGLAVMGPIFGSPIVILNSEIEQAFGWRAVLIGYGIAVLVGITLLSRVARERPEPYGLRPDGDPPEEGAALERPTNQSARSAETGLSLRAVLHMKEFWLLTTYLSGTFIVNSAIQVHQIPYFEQDVGLSRTSSAAVLTLVFLLSGIGRIGGGYVMDWIDYRIVLAGVTLAMGLSLVYLQLTDIQGLWMALPFAVLFGISFGATVPMRGALGSLMFGTRSLGSVIGLMQGGSVAAGMLGPISLGVIFDLNGNYSAGLWGLIAVSVLMVPVALALASPGALAKRTATMTNKG